MTDSLDLGALLDLGVAAARAGGEIVARSFDDPPEARSKAVGDWVSDVDTTSERAVREILTEAAPTIPVFGEEEGGERGALGWLVDPLDGTTNFLHHFPVVGVSIGLVADGTPVVGVVHAPMLGDTYTAVRGGGAHRNGQRLAVSTRPPGEAVCATGFPFRRAELLAGYLPPFEAALGAFEDLRRAGAASLDLAWVASGSFDGYFELALGPWDVAAGALLVAEAGGRVSDWEGDEDAWLDSGDIVVGNPAVHGRLLTIMQAERARAGIRPTCREAVIRRRSMSARRLWVPVVAFLAVAAVVWIVLGISVEIWWHNPANLPSDFPHQPYLDGWLRFDAGWYLSIARVGYQYHGPDIQSSVAFFPAYPLLITVLDNLIGNTALTGVLITFFCGLAVAVMFYVWVAARIGVRAARFSLAVLLLYPFAYYLYGAVYSDALFMAATLGAFLLLEADRPLLAGLAGAIATASRPVGIAVVIGLVIRALERRGALVGSPFTADAAPAEVAGPGPRDGPGALATEVRPTIGWFPRRFDFGAVRGRDAGVLLSVGGLLGYVAYLQARFGEPFAFAAVERAWGQSPGIRTWLKADVVDWLVHPPYTELHPQIVVAAPLTFAALALVPFVVRRFGWGYASYALAVVLIPAVSTKDFVGLARYVLVAFPCAAVVGAFLSTRRWATIVYFSISVPLLVLFLVLWSRADYVT